MSKFAIRYSTFDIHCRARRWRSGFGYVVNVNVLGVMPMFMGMNDAVGVGVEMRVWLIADRVADAPEEVHQPKSKQKPARQIAANLLEVFQLQYGHTERNTDKTQGGRAEDVTDAAGERNEDGFSHGPSARAGHGHERQVVIRPEHGMHEGDRCGCGAE